MVRISHWSAQCRAQTTTRVACAVLDHEVLLRCLVRPAGAPRSGRGPPAAAVLNHWRGGALAQRYASPLAVCGHQRQAVNGSRNDQDCRSQTAAARRSWGRIWTIYMDETPHVFRELGKLAPAEPVGTLDSYLALTRRARAHDS